MNVLEPYAYLRYLFTELPKVETAALLTDAASNLNIMECCWQRIALLLRLLRMALT